MTNRIAVASFAGLILAAFPAVAGEFYIGEPVVKEGMQIVPNYLVGIEMDRHPHGMAMDKNAIHLEVDVHATKDETHGFAEDAWIPYLRIKYKLIRLGNTTGVGGIGSKFETSGELYPMTAKDGPHYANNVKFGAAGLYRLTYTIEPPSSNGFIRHIDAASGVPAWWAPITASWNFNYPSKTK